ncbi:YtfJ family protein [Photobacterium sagamiensis]|uniref:YtfJ family protein n=1 Tax=Photobacterium sagamiensis TaxID=2910241 RepID=UPI003D11C5EA
MKTKILSLAAAFALIPTIASAHNIEVGKVLPAATVSEGGIASVSGDDVDFNKWNTAQLPTSGTTVIIAAAARPSANEMTPEDLNEKLENSKNIKYYKLVNGDDAPFGAGVFIKGAIKDGKVAKPNVETVLDDNGEVFYEWDLQPESSAVVVLKDGKVAYVHEGTITDAEKSEVLKQIM